MASRLCQFCRGVRAVVYCESDGAPLCLECDGCVHSANALSSRHLRSLICDRCVSEVAVVRCQDEKLSFCQGCDNGCFLAEHRRVTLRFYNGCPSLTEFSKLWPFFHEGTDPQQDLVIVNENEAGGSSSSMVVVNEVAPTCVEFGEWAVPSPPPPGPAPQLIPKYAMGSSFSRDFMPFLPQESTLQKLNRRGENVNEIGVKETEVCERVDVDGMPVTFEGVYEMFENPQNQPGYHCNNRGVTGLLNASLTESNFTQIESAMEVVIWLITPFNLQPFWFCLFLPRIVTLS